VIKIKEIIEEEKKSMKITKYLWLIFVIVLYALNYFWLKIGIWTYTGIVLGILLVLVVAINIFIKIKNRKGKTDDDFIFSPKIANTMKAVSIETQYEASILSIFCLMVGMLLFVIYVIFIAPYNWIMKVFIAFNSICGIVLIGSMLVTNYQQLMAHKESIKMLGELANQFGTEILSPNKIKSGDILTPFEDKKEPLGVGEPIIGEKNILDWARKEDEKTSEFKPKEYIDDSNPFLKNNKKEVLDKW
jgi:Ca2+/Na+ antiporter